MVDFTITVAVECHSGYTFAERPVAFYWDGQRHVIERVLKQWRSPDGPGFLVITANGVQVELMYDETNDKWYLEQKPGEEKDRRTPATRAGLKPDFPPHYQQRKENEVDA